MTPFTLVSPSQFRAKPPPSLQSAEWARDYNEFKHLGAKNSTKRTARQTEDARFWLLVAPRAYNLSPGHASLHHLRAYTDEVANARICAGFHHRFPTIVRREMGQKIGAHVVKSVLQPVKAAMAQ